MRRALSFKSPKAFCLLLLALVALGISGCATTESENASARPWNAPKGWENGLPSSLYEGR
jgi:hypothetical protein